jgi:hypothetical protein
MSLHTADSSDEVWPESHVFIRTSQNSRLFFVYAGTRSREAGFSDGQVGIQMDFYFASILKVRERRHPDVARNKFLMLRTGYLFDKTNPHDVSTVFMELTNRFYMGHGIQVIDRNRGDLRFQNGAFLPRYRNRVQMQRPSELGAHEINPYANAEAFYDWRYNAFNRQRYSAGAEYTLTRHFVLEGYYLRQQDSHTKPKGLNVLGAVLQIYVR